MEETVVEGTIYRFSQALAPRLLCRSATGLAAELEDICFLEACRYIKLSDDEIFISPPDALFAKPGLKNAYYSIVETLLYNMHLDDGPEGYYNGTKWWNYANASMHDTNRSQTQTASEISAVAVFDHYRPRGNEDWTTYVSRHKLLDKYLVPVKFDGVKKGTGSAESSESTTEAGQQAMELCFDYPTEKLPHTVELYIKTYAGNGPLGASISRNVIQGLASQGVSRAEIERKFPGLVKLAEQRHVAPVLGMKRTKGQRHAVPHGPVDEKAGVAAGSSVGLGLFGSSPAMGQGLSSLNIPLKSAPLAPGSAAAASASSILASAPGATPTPQATPTPTPASVTGGTFIPPSTTAGRGDTGAAPIPPAFTAPAVSAPGSTPGLGLGLGLGIGAPSTDKAPVAGLGLGLSSQGLFFGSGVSNIGAPAASSTTTPHTLNTPFIPVQSPPTDSKAANNNTQ